MLVRWTAQARSDPVRLHDFLAASNSTAAARVAQDLRAAPSALRLHPRLGRRLERHDPREVRRLIVGDYELRYEVRPRLIAVLNIWRVREDR